VAQEDEKLAAPAADVEHRCVVAEVLDVRALAAADIVGRAAHPALEGEVVGQRRGPRLAGHGLSAGGTSTSFPRNPLPCSAGADRRLRRPFEPRQALPGLAEQPLRLLTRGALAVKVLREV